MNKYDNRGYRKLNFIYLALKLFKIFRETFFIYIFTVSVFKFMNFFLINPLVLVIILLLIRINKLVLYWISFEYKVDNSGISIKKGILNISSNHIPISNIKEVNQHTPFLYKLMNGCMLFIYTDTNNQDGKIQLDFVSLKEASEIVKTLDRDIDVNHDSFKYKQYNYSYIASKKDMFFSSISPISPLIFAMFIYSLIDNLNKYFHLNWKVQSLIDLFKYNFWLLVLLAVPYFLLSCVYIYIRTYLKFGEYKLFHNKEEIFIEKGTYNKSHLIISKDRIQALIIKWNLIQKIFGIAKVEVITSSDENEDENNFKSNILIPFAQKNQINNLINEISPYFNVDVKLKNISRITVLSKILYSFCILGIIGWLIHNFLHSFELIYILFAILVVLGKIMEGLRSKYLYNNNNIYYKKSNLVTTLTVIPKFNIEEYKYTQNFLQRYIKLFSLKIVIKKAPYTKIKIANIPIEDLKCKK